MLAMNEHGEDPLYINTGAFTTCNKGSLESVGLAMDLVTIIWWPTKDAFEFDPALLAERINHAAPGRKINAMKLRKLAEEARQFFTVLPDGRWAPSPEFFSVTTGSPGSEN